MPACQELGILAGQVPIARQLEDEVDRKVFVLMTKAGLTDVDAVLRADEDTLLDCVGNDHDLLRKMRHAAKAAEEEAAQPVLTDILPPLTD